MKTEVCHTFFPILFLTLPGRAGVPSHQGTSGYPSRYQGEQHPDRRWCLGGNFVVQLEANAKDTSGLYTGDISDTSHLISMPDNLTHSSLAGDTVKLADFGCSKRTDETLTCLGFTEQALRRRFRPWDLSLNFAHMVGAKFHGSTAFGLSIHPLQFSFLPICLSRHTMRGSIPWMAPEVVLGRCLEAVIVQRCGVQGAT